MVDRRRKIEEKESIVKMLENIPKKIKFGRKYK